MTLLPQAKPYLYDISPYKAGKTAKQADVIPVKLSSNENPYGPSPKALEAYVKASSSLHRYPDGSCHDLRHAIGGVHQINPDQILCGAGSDELIGLLVHSYAGQGDEVLFTEHAFLMYKIYTLAAGATPVEAEETELKADIEKLLAKVTDRTKIVFIANSNNPTGSYLTNQELWDLRQRLPSHIILAIDGAYAEYGYAEDYEDGQEIAITTENTVMLRTFSKIYGMPALRLGWMVASPAIIDAVSRIKSPFNVGTPAQKAGIAAIEDREYVLEHHQRNREQLHYLIEAFRDLGLNAHPSQGNFTLVDFGDAGKAQAIVKALEAKHIFIRDVSSYKLPTCLRVSVGTVEENQSLLKAMESIIL